MPRTTIRSEDITDLQVKTGDVAAGGITTAKMATDPTDASNLTSGSVPSGRLGNVDTAGIVANKEDIALLAFKVAANGSLARYNLIDQTIDDFQDATGVDAGASTGESRNAANYYSAISSSSDAATWVFGGDNAGGVSYGTNINGGGGIRLDAAFDNTLSQNQSTAMYDDQSSVKYIGKDAGSTVTQTASNWSARGANDYGFNNPWSNGNATIYLQYSSDGTNWTTAASQTSSGAPGTIGGSFTETAGYRYWRILMTAGGDFRVADFSLYGVKSTQTVNASMTLISNATTAEAVPTKGDFVITWSDGVGTGTLNTDITAEFSADNGSTWTAVTLANQGTSGGHNIATANDVTLTSTSGTSMRWRVKTLNQSITKETRINGVSLGWS